MPFDPLQAARSVVRLQQEVRQLKQQVGQLRAENHQLRTENHQLRAENQLLHQECDRLREKVHQLQEQSQRLQQQVEQLQRENARQAAPFRRREKKKVPPEKKKRPGRKGGHEGSCRRVPPQIDQEEEVPLECCPHCQGPLSNTRPVVQIIEELVPMRPRVTRVVTWQGECSRCGQVRSTHPLQTSTGEGAARVQLGPRALALAAALNKQQGLSMRKTCWVLRTLCGLRISPGGLSQALARVAGRVEGEYGRLGEQLRMSQAVFVDETSWWVGGPGWWLWVFTTREGLVYYRVESSRGSQVVQEVLGEKYRGVMVSDCLSSYDPPDYRKHKCIAHHLQAIARAREREDTEDPWYLDQWRELFGEVLELYHRRGEYSAEAFAARRQELEGWVDRLLAHSCQQPGDVSVRNRLRKQREHLLVCLEEPWAEPTNNRAERALRPAVVARKLSCGNKTEAGRRSWQILASLAATCEGLATDFVEFLAARLPLASQPG